MFFKYTCQVSLVGLLYAWTREVEIGIFDCKNDRRGLQTASKRFATLIQKIPSTLTRAQWKTPTQPVLPLHKLRLEGVLTVRQLFVFRSIENSTMMIICLFKIVFCVST